MNTLLALPRRLVQQIGSGRVLAAGVLVLSVAILGPLLFTERTFGEDWSNHLWLIWTQSDAISRTGHPSLFFQAAPWGVFYPHFLFYGGTLYGLTGGLAAALGGRPIPAYLLSFVLAFAVAWGGFWWLARQLGLRGAAALVPGLLFVTSAYYLTNFYARGTWPETVATSMLPLVAASGLWLLRTPRWRPGPVAAFLASVALLTGSHNITTLFGTTFLLLLGVAALIALPRRGREVAGRRVLGVGALAVLATALNAWSLVPNLAYSKRTSLGGADPFEGNAPFFNTWTSIFDPLRHVSSASSTPSLYVQAPVLAMLWAAVAWWMLSRTSLPRQWKVMAAGVGVVTLGFLALALRDAVGLTFLMHGVWANLPRPYRFVQFAYRLQTYVTLGVCGLVLLALRSTSALPASRRWALTLGLAALCAFSSGIAIWQAWTTPSYLPNRHIITAGSPQALATSWSDPGAYRDASLPVVGVAEGRRVVISSRDAASGHVHVDPAPAGPEPFATDIAAGPYLLRLSGANVAGRTDDGYLVLVRPPGRPTGPLDLRIDSSRIGAVAAGRSISLLALALLVLGALAWTATALRDRRGPLGRAQSAG